MVTSNTYLFGTNTQIDDLIRESFERIGIIGNEFTGLQIQSAVMSANLLLTEWMGQVPLSWLKRRLMVEIYPNQPAYQLRKNVTRIIDVVATQPARLNSGGTAFSSAGGSPANCFTAGTTAGCIQTSPDGYISYDYGVGNSNSIYYVGITTLGNQETYTLSVDYSFDNVNWNTIYSAPTQIYYGNQITWFVIPNTLNARVWRVRESGGATLQLQQIYFTQPSNINTGDRTLFGLSYTEYMQIPNKMIVGFPSGFMFDKQINPILTLWPVPNGVLTGSYTAILYTAYLYCQDVTALFQQFELPQRFYEALVSGMSYKLAVKFAADKVQMLKGFYGEAWNAAINTDYENVTLRFQPDNSSISV